MFYSAPKFIQFFVDNSVSGRSPRLPTRLRDVADDWIRELRIGVKPSTPSAPVGSVPFQSKSLPSAPYPGIRNRREEEGGKA